jgi:hypothetical protein
MKFLLQLIASTMLLSVSSESIAMNLKLQYPPTPEFAQKHAETAVSAVKNIEHVSLDYSPESLKIIDGVIQGFRRDGVKEDQVAETLFSFGCYAGEVLVRNQKGIWANPKDVMPANIAQHFPFMVVKLANGHIWSPISKAFSEMENGQEDSLEYLYQVAAKP